MDINTGNKINPFVPDISPTSAPSSQPISGGSAAPSFKDTVKELLGNASDQINQSDQLSRDLATGKTHDVSKVVTSVEEANLSMSFTLAVRNKLMDAYTEISRMQL